MTETTEISLIDQSIAALARALEATRVPGELAQWLAPMQRALAQVSKVLQGDLSTRHRKDYRQIAKDVSLLPRVAQLEAEDADLLNTVRLAEALAAKAATILNQSKEQDEATLTLQELGELAHSLVIRLRSQEQAIDTWFFESMNRDEGVSG